jgi:hypothetical protein
MTAGSAGMAARRTWRAARTAVLLRDTNTDCAENGDAYGEGCDTLPVTSELLHRHDDLHLVLAPTLEGVTDEP